MSGVVFEKVPTGEDSVVPETSPASRSVSKSGKVKHGKTISWTNVNFLVKDKSVLKDCWGEVTKKSLLHFYGM